MKEITFDLPTSSFADYAPVPAEEGVESVESEASEASEAPHIPVGLSDYIRNESGALVLCETSHQLARELYYSDRVAYDSADSRRSIGRYNSDGTIERFVVQYNVQVVVK
jgi:hypothetical protein